MSERIERAVQRKRGEAEPKVTLRGQPLPFDVRGAEKVAFELRLRKVQRERQAARR